MYITTKKPTAHWVWVCRGWTSYLTLYRSFRRRNLVMKPYFNLAQCIKPTDAQAMPTLATWFACGLENQFHTSKNPWKSWQIRSLSKNDQIDKFHQHSLHCCSKLLQIITIPLDTALWNGDITGPVIRKSSLLWDTRATGWH